MHYFETLGFIDVERERIRYLGASGHSADAIQRLVGDVARNDGVPVTPEYVGNLPERLHGYTWAERRPTRVFRRP